MIGAEIEGSITASLFSSQEEINNAVIITKKIITAFKNRILLRLLILSTFNYKSVESPNSFRGNLS